VRIAAPRDEFGFYITQEKASAENMVLVNAVRNLAFPNPATPELVPIATLVEQNITHAKSQCFNVSFERRDFLHVRKVEVTSLHVRDTQIRHDSCLVFQAKS